MLKLVFMLFIVAFVLKGLFSHLASNEKKVCEREMYVWDATVTGSVLDLDHEGSKCLTNNPKVFAFS